jgi:hypothetical protein
MVLTISMMYFRDPLFQRGERKVLETKPETGSAHWGTNTQFRARRLAGFVAIIDEILAGRDAVNLLDIGGTAAYWLDLEPVWRGRPINFTLVNLEPEHVSDPRFKSIVADCRDLAQFSDNAFDVVHSNSVIEHVGRWRDMRAMAREVRRLAPRYFVQTPNFWFPLEPHFRVPFFHWLPEPLRIGLVRRRSCGAFPRAENIDDAQRFIEDSILIDAPRLAALFPEARIERERFLGLTKSLIAIR